MTNEVIIEMLLDMPPFEPRSSAFVTQHNQNNDQNGSKGKNIDFAQFLSLCLFECFDYFGHFRGIIATYLMVCDDILMVC